MTLAEILKILKTLSKGATVHKCKLDGKPTEVDSGTIKVKLPYLDVQITCKYKDNGTDYTVNAIYPHSGNGKGTIKINSVNMTVVKDGLRGVVHMPPEVKSTLDYKGPDGIAHELEIYADLA